MSAQMVDIHLIDTRAALAVVRSSGIMIKGVATMAICFPILLVLHHSLDWE
jgi:carbamoylphosphate synthase small subunit